MFGFHLTCCTSIVVSLLAPVPNIQNLRSLSLKLSTVSFLLF